MDGKVVVFGAGATGRAHVGLLAWQSGMEVVFVDKRADLVSALQRAGEYRVRLIGETSRDLTVRGFRCYGHLKREAIARQIREAALVLTAVFPENLADVAETVSLAVRMCRESARQTPLNCVCCENMMDSSSALRRHVRALLAEEDLAYCDAVFGFPDCMISRVVPQPEDPAVSDHGGLQRVDRARRRFPGRAARRPHRARIGQKTRPRAWNESS